MKLTRAEHETKGAIRANEQSVVLKAKVNKTCWGGNKNLDYTNTSTRDEMKFGNNIIKKKMRK